MTNSKAERALEKQVNGDIAANDPAAFHQHIAQAILNDATPEDAATAIRNNKEALAKVYKAQTGQELDVEAFIQNELDSALMTNLFMDLSDDED